MTLSTESSSFASRLSRSILCVSSREGGSKSELLPQMRSLLPLPKITITPATPTKECGGDLFFGPPSASSPVSTLNSRKQDRAIEGYPTSIEKNLIQEVESPLDTILEDGNMKDNVDARIARRSQRANRPKQPSLTRPTATSFFEKVIEEQARNVELADKGDASVKVVGRQTEEAHKQEVGADPCAPSSYE